MKNSICVICLMISIKIFANPENQISLPHESWGKPLQSVDKLKYINELKQTSEAINVNFEELVSYQVNVNAQGMNIIGDAANEPSIAVNPLNPKQISIGWRQFNSITSSFREAGRAYSDDGGLTWVNIGPFEPGIFRSDPVLASGPDGTFFYQSLKVEESNGVPGIQGDDLFLIDQWRSTDGGKNWFDKTPVFGGDKSWIAVDQSSDGSTGNIYAAWNTAGNGFFPNTFNYSVDNGQSYTSPEVIPRAPIFGTVAIGIDGEVFVVGTNGGANLESGLINLIRSNNITSQMLPDFNQITPLNMGGAVSVGGVNPAGLLGQIWVAVDKSERHTRGNVYVFSSIDPIGEDPLDVHFKRSTNGGNDFEPVVRVNTDLQFNDWQWLGTMGVAPNGRIDLIWLDTRNQSIIDPNTGTKIISQLFYSYSYDGGVSFSKNRPISPLFNHSSGYPIQQKMGDYFDIVSDNKGAHIAYAATFTGGQDVYYHYAKSAAVEENPYFPSHEMDNAWAVPGVPSQGILSSTLVSRPGQENQQLQNFEAVFTATPQGEPIWLILQTEHPIVGDKIQFPIYMPTGDLSENGTATKVIGVATKSRIYDESGDLISGKMKYTFQMTDEVKSLAQSLTGQAAQFDETFYQSNSFFGTEKELEFSTLIPMDQDKIDYCNVNAQVFTSTGEKSEGRLQMTYRRDDKLNLFAADFTYKKSVNEQGEVTIILNQDGVATPTWEVINSTANGIGADGSSVNQVDKPNGGLAFFEASDTSPGVSLIGQESSIVDESNSIIVTKPMGDIESMSVLAVNSFCGIQY
jgi:hypothetical protein